MSTTMPNTKRKQSTDSMAEPAAKKVKKTSKF